MEVQKGGRVSSLMWPERLSCPEGTVPEVLQLWAQAHSSGYAKAIVLRVGCVATSPKLTNTAQCETPDSHMRDASAVSCVQITIPSEVMCP